LLRITIEDVHARTKQVTISMFWENDVEIWSKIVTWGQKTNTTHISFLFG